MFDLFLLNAEISQLMYVKKFHDCELNCELWACFFLRKNLKADNSIDIAVL